MKKLIKRKLLSLIMSSIMIIGCLPLSGFTSGAAEDETATPSDASEVTTETEDEESPELLASSGTQKITKDGSITVNGTTGGLFHAGASTAAYCGDHYASQPSTNTYSYSECTNTNIRRVLAYVADTYGINYSSIPNATRLRISLAVYNAKHNASHSLGTEILEAAYDAYPSDPLTGDEVDIYLKDDPTSTTANTVSNVEASTEYSITTVSGNKATVYITDKFYLELNSKNTVTVKLPAGVYMQYNSEWYEPGSTVEIEGVSAGYRTLRLGVIETLSASQAITFTGLRGYNVYEADCGSGYQNIYWVTTTGTTSVSLTLTPNPPTGNGYIRLKKSFEDSDYDDLSNYSIAGAVYKVYTTSGDGGSKGTYIGTFKTNSSGWGHVEEVNTEKGYAISSGEYSILNVTAGTWIYVIETEASPGCSLDTEVHYDVVSADTILTVKSEEPVDLDPLRIRIYKVDSVTGNATATAAGTLKGAKFTINYYDVDPDKITSLAKLESSGATPTRTWVFETDENGFIDTQNTSYFVSTESSKLYMQDGDPVIPVGVITIEETEAPEGYTTNGSYFVNNSGTEYTDSVIFASVTESSGMQFYLRENYIDADNATLTKTEIPDRADIKLKKVDSETGEPISGVAFSLTSTTTGESHILVTDENGIIDTSAIAHSKNTNANDKASESDYAPCGIWFSGDSSTGTIDDSLGALPYDTYILHELSTDANADYVLSISMLMVKKFFRN